MSWKDHFYIEDRDRTTIIFLLLLIIISGVGYILMCKNTAYIPKNEEDIYLSELMKTNQNLDKPHTNQELKPITTYYSNKFKTGETIDLNLADTTDLKRIPGIGTVYANRIVKYRSLLGGYTNINQLYEVWGINSHLYEKVTPYLIIDTKPKKLSINTLEFKQLLKHPYLNYDQTKAIVDIRSRKGKISSINRLALLDEFSEDDINKLSPYLSFD